MSCWKAWVRAHVHGEVQVTQDSGGIWVEEDRVGLRVRKFRVNEWLTHLIDVIKSTLFHPYANVLVTVFLSGCGHNIHLRVWSCSWGVCCMLQMLHQIRLDSLPWPLLHKCLLLVFQSNKLGKDHWGRQPQDALLYAGVIPEQIVLGSLVN